MANADIYCYMCQQQPVGANWTVDASCTGTSCTNCKNTTSTRNGIITTTTATMLSNCPTGLTGTITCSCRRTYSYKCAAGYYGQPTSSLMGQCTEFPGNGTSPVAPVVQTHLVLAHIQVIVITVKALNLLILFTPTIAAATIIRPPQFFID